jgi:hypothetical protein
MSPERYEVGFYIPDVAIFIVAAVNASDLT